MSQQIEIVQEETEYNYTDLIDNQLAVISTMSELDIEAYDTLAEDRIKAISNAMKIIHKSQRAILECL
ncbi:MAG: hypothetical protein EBR82_73360 [Caulobacteraceae bacterium]|nr:hypothetical protein [Caulobacteraceae bacterium]